jgi:carboxyl-terminal processing protease
MSYYVFTILDQKRTEFNSFSFKEFSDSYVVTTQVAQGFIDYIRELSGVYLNLEPTSPGFKLALKAAMAEQLYGPEEKEILLNLQDAMILKVLQIEEKKKQ